MTQHLRVHVHGSTTRKCPTRTWPHGTSPLQASPTRSKAGNQPRPVRNGAHPLECGLHHTTVTPTWETRRNLPRTWSASTGMPARCGSAVNNPEHAEIVSHYLPQLAVFHHHPRGWFSRLDTLLYMPKSYYVKIVESESSWISLFLTFFLGQQGIGSILLYMQQNTKIDISKTRGIFYP